MAPWIAALVILTPIAVGGYYAYSFYQSKYHPADFTGAGYGSVMVEVNSGDTATSLAPELLNNGVIASDRAFVLAAEHSTNTQGLVPGTFRMHKHMQATLAYAMLVNPANVVEFTARIPEGLRATDIIARLAAADPHISPSAYQQALKNLSALGLPPYAHGKPEGYLYPDTYQIQPNASALSVLQQMVQSFNLEAGAVNLTQNAHPDQVIIVASLVQAEGGSVSDYPKIARVIYNRLAQGMRLQLDSTVLYGLNTYGILARGTQLQSDSPYNTYKFKGLPPGPIDSPGAAAIQAALNPAAGNWLYFVTVDPKTKLTKFTSSYTQFLEFEQELRHNTTTGR
ncbi:MAG: endolytic transglycosylase MltG [Streptosporangiaceae bacterium]|nr:endolytic transglycosylase MltG [Streptosporangiaceae bacterium]